MRRLAVHCALVLSCLLLSACGIEQVFGPTPTPAVVILVATPAPNAPSAAAPTTAAPLTTAAASSVPQASAAASADTAPPASPTPDAAPASTAAPGAGATQLCIAGSNTVLGQDTAQMRATWTTTLAQRFNISLSIDGSGSEAAIEAARSGKCVDALVTSEPLNQGQVQQLNQAGIGVSEPTTIGYDAIVFVTDRANPAPALSLDQIAGVLNGDTNDWSQLGGANTPIQVLLRPGSGTTNFVLVNVAKFEPFVTVAGQPFPPNLKYTECGRDGGNRACLEQAAATKGAFYWAARYLVQGNGVRPVPLRDQSGAPIDPTGLAFDVQSYPKELVRGLYIYLLDQKGANADGKIAAATFRAYLLSAAGQQSLVDQGFFRSGS